MKPHAMDEEGSINFKALRAKFQEEALMAESTPSRPAVAGKPKHLPPPFLPPGGHCSFVVSSISVAVEKGTPVVPRVIFKDGLRASGGKRPISFLPHPQRSPSSQLANRDGTARQSLKDRHMPLVLPVLPVKEHKAEVLAKKEHKSEPDKVKEALPHTKLKKKGLLLPFKSSKATKVNTDHVEEPSHADLTRRPSSAPGELPSMEKRSTEDGCLLQSDQSISDCPHSSPDIAITPPSAETSTDSENRIISTLERAKKKFSRQLLISSKPKSVHPLDRLPRGKALASPPKSTESIEPDPPIPPPVCLPHLACISARPFFKVSSARKSPSQKHFGWDQTDHLRVRTGVAHHQSAPPKRPLPELRLLGLLPQKPPRPPSLDLNHYRSSAVQEGSPGLSQAPTKEPEVELTSVLNPVLDAPQFPDFENSEVDTAPGEAVDIAALELEALDLVSSDLPVPDDFGISVSDIPPPEWSVCGPEKSSALQKLNLGNQNIIPVNPASFPEPINMLEFPEPPVLESWSQSEEATADPSSTSHADETDLGAAEFPSVPEETDVSDHAPVNHNSHPSVHQQDIYNKMCDNVYEDVENISKFIVSHNSRTRKGALKNPYADNVPVKEEVGLNIWPRNPWAGVAGEHAPLALNHINSKEPQSPNTADNKEQKKREKQRLGKEKKEQKEREKKENEMKKKFKVTGEEEPMYHAKVMVASKVRKNDLPVKHGDTVSIIRTTNCPKGKWLARDANHKYGYISVMNVELNIKEMLELGKKAQAAGRGCNAEADTISIESRSSSYPVLTSSFTDDSEEWACEDATLSPSNESHGFPQQTAPMPEMSCGHVGTQHTLGDANLDELHTETRHEALQKLTIFFQHNEEEFSESGGATPTNAEPPGLLFAVEEPPYLEQEVDFSEMELLPPPPLYADTF